MPELAYNRLSNKAVRRVVQPDSYHGLDAIAKIFNAAGEQAFITLSGLDLDTDGVRDPGIHYESTHQDATSIDPSAAWCNSNTIPFFVLPGRFPHGGCTLDTMGTIFYGGNHVHAIFADWGPQTKFGEASIAVHRALGFERVKNGHIVDVGIEGDVTTLIYIDQRCEIHRPTFEDIQRLGERLLSRWL